VTDAERVYEALGALLGVATDAWDKQAYDEEWGTNYQLWAEIADWADDMRRRMHDFKREANNAGLETEGDILW
jgi:hypothetical protein